MPELSGLIARLLVDEQPLEEFAVGMEDGTILSCFVASEEDKAFSIEIVNESDYELVVFEFLVDGTPLDSFLLREGQWKLRDTVKTSPDLCQALRFGGLVTEEYEDIFDPSNVSTDVSSIGTVEFRVWPAAVMKELPQGGKWERSLPSTPISERNKVSSPHRISLGPATRKPRGPRLLVRRIDEENGPIARIIFRYRSREFLQANGFLDTPQTEQLPEYSNNAHMKRAAPEEPALEDGSKPPRKKPRRKKRPAAHSEETNHLASKNVPGDGQGSQSDATAEVVQLREQLRIMQERLDRLEGVKPIKFEPSLTWTKQELPSTFFVKKESLSQVCHRTKREVSPIRLPFPSGQVIDLTDD